MATTATQNLSICVFLGLPVCWTMNKFYGHFRPPSLPCLLFTLLALLSEWSGGKLLDKEMRLHILFWPQIIITKAGETLSLLLRVSRAPVPSC